MITLQYSFITLKSILSELIENNQLVLADLDLHTGPFQEFHYQNSSISQHLLFFKLTDGYVLWNVKDGLFSIEEPYLKKLDMPMKPILKEMLEVLQKKSYLLDGMLQAKLPIESRFSYFELHTFISAFIDKSSPTIAQNEFLNLIDIKPYHLDTSLLASNIGYYVLPLRDKTVLFKTDGRRVFLAEPIFLDENFVQQLKEFAVNLNDDIITLKELLKSFRVMNKINLK